MNPAEVLVKLGLVLGQVPIAAQALQDSASGVTLLSAKVSEAARMFKGHPDQDQKLMQLMSLQVQFLEQYVRRSESFTATINALVEGTELELNELTREETR